MISVCWNARSLNGYGPCVDLPVAIQLDSLMSCVNQFPKSIHNHLVMRLMSFSLEIGREAVCLIPFYVEDIHRKPRKAIFKHFIFSGIGLYIDIF